MGLGVDAPERSSEASGTNQSPQDTQAKGLPVENLSIRAIIKGMGLSRSTSCTGSPRRALFSKTRSLPTRAQIPRTPNKATKRATSKRSPPSPRNKQRLDSMSKTKAYNKSAMYEDTKLERIKEDDGVKLVLTEESKNAFIIGMQMYKPTNAWTKCITPVVVANKLFPSRSLVDIALPRALEATRQQWGGKVPTNGHIPNDIPKLKRLEFFLWKTMGDYYEQVYPEKQHDVYVWRTFMDYFRFCRIVMAQVYFCMMKHTREEVFVIVAMKFENCQTKKDVRSLRDLLCREHYKENYPENYNRLGLASLLEGDRLLRLNLRLRSREATAATDQEKDQPNAEAKEQEAQEESADQEDPGHLACNQDNDHQEEQGQDESSEGLDAEEANKQKRDKAHSRETDSRETDSRDTDNGISEDEDDLSHDANDRTFSDSKRKVNQGLGLESYHRDGKDKKRSRRIQDTQDAMRASKMPKVLEIGPPKWYKGDATYSDPTDEWARARRWELCLITNLLNVLENQYELQANRMNWDVEVQRILTNDYEIEHVSHEVMLFAMGTALQLSPRSKDDAVLDVIQQFKTKGWLSAQAILDTPEIEMLEVLAPSGYQVIKAVNLKTAATYLLEHHGGWYPRNYKMLLEVPGMGVKSATILAQEGCGYCLWPAVDVHAARTAVSCQFVDFGQDILLSPEHMNRDGNLVGSQENPAMDVVDVSSSKQRESVTGMLEKWVPKSRVREFNKTMASFAILLTQKVGSTSIEEQRSTITHAVQTHFVEDHQSTLFRLIDNTIHYYQICKKHAQYKKLAQQKGDAEVEDSDDENVTLLSLGKRNSKPSRHQQDHADDTDVPT